jgi:tetratricopeptide (TPR) repeat protein
MYQHYTWGWSFVHFLMSSPKYAKKFKSWYVDLAKGKQIDRVKDGRNLDSVQPQELWRSLQTALGLKKPKDVKRLEQDWHEYVEHELEVTSTHGLENAAEAARNEGRRLRAKRLFGEADASGAMRAVSWYRYGLLLIDLKEPAQAIDALRQAVDLDPLEVDFRIELAKALIDDTATKESAKQHLSLARDIDPTNYWLARNYKVYMRK